MQFTFDGSKLIIFLAGRLDSSNTEDIEKELSGIRAQHPAGQIELDCGSLEYISSAGLRVILRMKKEAGNVILTNVSPKVHEIFEITGFTEMMEIRRAYRTVSTDGCEIIGQGANGRVCRIDKETVLKEYFNPDALAEIEKENSLARKAFILGIPTAISYDIVKVRNGGYGAVYELLNAKSYAQLLRSGEKTVEEIAPMSVELLKLIHGTEVAPGTLPSMKETAAGWADFLKDYLQEDLAARLCRLIDAVPEDLHVVHGDFHVKNIMYQNGESLLIDMDTLCCGHPVFELSGIYNAYVGFGITDPPAVEKYMGIPYDQAAALWNRMLQLYLGTEDEKRLAEAEAKAKLIGLVRIMRRTIRRQGFETEAGRRLIACCKTQLEMLLPETETLTIL